MDVKRKADALLARLDKKCGNSGIPDGAKCSKGEAGSSGHWSETEDDPMARAVRFRRQNPKKAMLGDIAKVAGVVGAYALSKSIASKLNEVAIQKQHGVSAKEAKEVRQQVKEIEKKQGSAAGSAYYREWAKQKKSKADARLDVKCGKGAISFGEKCHSSAVMGAIAMGSAAINSQGFERSVMSHHAVSQNEAREFGRSLSAVHQQGGAEKAKEHYTTWAKNVVTMAKKVA
jgi:hypothetical protein